MKKITKIILTILSGAILLLGLGTIAAHFFGSDSLGNDPHARQVDLHKFTKIDAQTAAYSVAIQPGNKYHVTVSGKGKNNIAVKVSQQKLVIKEKQHHFAHFLFNYRPYILITLPARELLQSVNVNAQAGSADLTGINMQKLHLHLNAGAAKLTDVAVQRSSTIKLNAGSLKVSRSNLNLNAQLDAGSAKINNSKLHGDNHLNLSAGSLTISTPSKLSYDLSANIGKITFHGTGKEHQFKQTNTGVNKLTAKAKAGAIHIN